MKNKSQMPAKQPNIVWRVTRVVLHILGQVLLWAMIVGGTLALIVAIAGGIFMTKFSSYLKSDVIPAAEEYADNLDLGTITLAQTSVIYYLDSETGAERELQQLYATENRTWVAIDEIPDDLVNAAIAIEDKRYPEHDGVDWLRTLSAVKNFAGGDSSFGASTITQQLIKNLSQEDDVTIHRKVQEIFRALAVENLYTKDEIMEWYLNTIYLGEGCYGVQSAAKVYFAKDVSELTTAECASLISITNNPSLYDPYLNPKNNRSRQLTVLREMYDQGYIPSEAAYNTAVSQEMVFRNGIYDEKTYTCASCGFDGPRSQYDKGDDGEYYCPECATVNYSVDSNNAYSYFVDTIYRDVVNDLCDKYDINEKAAINKLLTGGYKIYATIDPEVQEIVDRVYEDLDNVPDTVSTQQLQSAIVVVDNETGDIIAMAGGVGEKEASLSLNRATQSKLNPGSSIKPLSVYAPALEAGVVTPGTVLEDSPLYDNWPQNESRSFGGPTLVQNGLYRSLNTISVKTLDLYGVQNSYNFMTQQLGFTTLVEELEIGGKTYSDIAYAPLALGELTWGLTVREMTQAYATFPNLGVFREARTYTRVVDQEGNVILDNTQESHTVLGEKATYYINSLLRGAVSYGTGGAAWKGNVAVYGKTGTSSNSQNRWFAGYTPYYTAVVWCGYDEPEQVKLSGSWTNPAITMWRQVMDPLHENVEYAELSTPDGVGWYSICADCGKAATAACEKDIRDDGDNRVTSVRLYWEDAPSSYCDCHTLVKICAESGKIANEYCELAEGNTVKEVGKILYEKAWSSDRGEDYVYNPNDSSCTCSIHTAESIKPSEEETEEPSTDAELPTTPPETEAERSAALLPTEDSRRHMPRAESLRKLN